MTDAITWADFKSQITALNPLGSPAYSHFLFRGHGSDEWSLESTLERTNHSEFVRDHYHLILRIKTEVEAFTGRTWPDDPSLTELDQIFSGTYDAYARTLMKGQPHYAYMAFLRHHGFPSPLLDWSGSPFVAAYLLSKIRLAIAIMSQSTRIRIEPVISNRTGTTDHPSGG